MKKLLFICLIIFSLKSFANSVVGKSLFCNDSKNQYRGIHFLDEEYIVAYRFFDQSMFENKIKYELSGWWVVMAVIRAIPQKLFKKGSL